MLFFPRAIVGRIRIVAIEVNLTFLVVGQQAPLQLLTRFALNCILFLTQEQKMSLGVFSLQDELDTDPLVPNINVCVKQEICASDRENLPMLR